MQEELHASYSILSFTSEKLPKEYKPLIFSKWLRSLRHGNPFFKFIESSQYYDKYHKNLERILNDSSCIIKLAVLSDDYDVVLGFSISRRDLLDYVYVQKDMRNQKIGSHLIPENINRISHLTKTGILIWKAKFNKWHFNPFD